MDSNPGGKKYGLIIPSKEKGIKSAFLSGTSKPKQTNKVFANDSSSEDLEEDDEEAQQAMDWRSRTASKAEEKSMQRSQARMAAMKALEEDPTVFQYDEVYDEMQQKKEEKKPPKEEKKPKYISNLLKTAEARKIEMERRTERKVQKEREAEGDEFNDKESFVTPAYRAKLAELKKLEEEERLNELREATLDVTKQRDLSGFYRHLYNQTFAEDKPKKADHEIEPVTFKKEAVDSEAKGRRHYRSRREEEEEEPVKERSPKPEEAEGKTDRRPAASAALVSAAVTDRAAVADRAVPKPIESEEESEDSEKSPVREEKEKTPPPPKVKIDIWKKRNTGDLLDEAIARYLARKEARDDGLIAWH